MALRGKEMNCDYIQATKCQPIPTGITATQENISVTYHYPSGGYYQENQIVVVGEPIELPNLLNEKGISKVDIKQGAETTTIRVKNG